jgi:hypothetical protein
MERRPLGMLMGGNADYEALCNSLSKLIIDDQTEKRIIDCLNA